MTHMLCVCMCVCVHVCFDCVCASSQSPFGQAQWKLQHDKSQLRFPDHVGYDVATDATCRCGLYVGCTTYSLPITASHTHSYSGDCRVRKASWQGRLDVAVKVLDLGLVKAAKDDVNEEVSVCVVIVNAAQHRRDLDSNLHSPPPTFSYVLC